MTISTHTNQLRNTIGEYGGELEIDYTVEVDQSMIGNHHFRMIIKSTGQDLDDK